jgi:hypothetical protein
MGGGRRESETGGRYYRSTVCRIMKFTKKLFEKEGEGGEGAWLRKSNIDG